MGEAPGSSLDRDTLEHVLNLVSKRCRQEVEEALATPRELSISCKQDIQSVLLGYDDSTSSQGDPVPDFVEDSALLRHQTAISLTACALAFLVILFRAFRRSRATPGDEDAGTRAKTTTTGGGGAAAAAHAPDASSSRRKNTKKKANSKKMK